MFLAKSDIPLEQCLSQYPSLKNRIELLIDLIEDSAGDCQKANKAEMRVIKKLWWHSTFGEVVVYEQEFRVSEQRFRPFSRLAEIHCRGCSTTLQRVITDFGADHAFGLVPKTIQEHYGIVISASTVRAITEYHAG